MACASIGTSRDRAVKKVSFLTVYSPYVSFYELSHKENLYVSHIKKLLYALSLILVYQINTAYADSHNYTTPPSFTVNTDQPISTSTSSSSAYQKTKNSQKTFSSIKNESHSEGDKLWCHDCRAPGEATGSGTGRWVYLNSASVWKTSDGLDASN